MQGADPVSPTTFRIIIAGAISWTGNVSGAALVCDVNMKSARACLVDQHFVIVDSVCPVRWMLVLEHCPARLSLTNRRVISRANFLFACQSSRYCLRLVEVFVQWYLVPRVCHHTVGAHKVPDVEGNGLQLQH